MEKMDSVLESNLKMERPVRALSFLSLVLVRGPAPQERPASVEGRVSDRRIAAPRHLPHGTPNPETVEEGSARGGEVRRWSCSLPPDA